VKKTNTALTMALAALISTGCGSNSSSSNSDPNSTAFDAAAFFGDFKNSLKSSDTSTTSGAQLAGYTSSNDIGDRCNFDTDDMGRAECLQDFWFSTITTKDNSDSLYGFLDKNIEAVSSSLSDGGWNYGDTGKYEGNVSIDGSTYTVSISASEASTSEIYDYKIQFNLSDKSDSANRLYLTENDSSKKFLWLPLDAEGNVDDDRILAGSLDKTNNSVRFEHFTASQKWNRANHYAVQLSNLQDDYSPTTGSEVSLLHAKRSGDSEESCSTVADSNKANWYYASGKLGDGNSVNFSFQQHDGTAGTVSATVPASLEASSITQSGSADPSNPELPAETKDEITSANDPFFFPPCDAEGWAQV